MLVNVALFNVAVTIVFIRLCTSYFLYCQVVSSKTTNPPPPHDIEIVRGSAYGIFSRKFVEFIVTGTYQLSKQRFSFVSPSMVVSEHRPNLGCPTYVYGKNPDVLFAHARLQCSALMRMVADQKAKALLEWSRKTYSPDEHYWATLHHTYGNPHLHTPGAFAGACMLSRGNAHSTNT